MILRVFNQPVVYSKLPTVPISKIYYILGHCPKRTQRWNLVMTQPITNERWVRLNWFSFNPNDPCTSPAKRIAMRPVYEKFTLCYSIMGLYLFRSTTITKWSWFKLGDKWDNSIVLTCVPDIDWQKLRGISENMMLARVEWCKTKARRNPCRREIYILLAAVRSKRLQAARGNQY